MYDVITVTEAQEWRQFLSVQRKVYDRRSPAIPLPEWEVRRLLDEVGNPALHGRNRYMLLVRHDGEAVGRCSLVLPKPGSKDQTAILGFFECIDDERAARALLERAEMRCLAYGIHHIHGPFNPTTSGVTGIQLDHFEDATILYEACSQPYYAALLEKAGYWIEQRGRSWRNSTLRTDMDALIKRLPDRPSRYHIRQMSLANLRHGVEDLAGVFDAAFHNNWSREPMVLEEYFFVARFLLPAWHSTSFSIVYDEDRAVGVALAFPDINPAFRSAPCDTQTLAVLKARRLARRSRSLLMFAIGMHPDHQKSPAGLVLARHMAGVARQYDAMYSTWITEGNLGSERMAVRFGLSPWKNFGVYRKEF
ncbi:MAG: hypothetical protein IH600_09785 [Bacteroidetes bacterium]|nr:hypothetical protein [Bacteroidota bacterium]